MNDNNSGFYSALARFVGFELEAWRKAISKGTTATRPGIQHAARDFVKFVRNAQIIPLLKSKHDSTAKFKPFDPFNLEHRLNELSGDCHPMADIHAIAEPPDTTDAARLARIETQLQILAGYVSRFPIPHDEPKHQVQTLDPTPAPMRPSLEP